MRKPMVDYKWLLLMIAGLYGSDEFDSKTFSDDLTLIMYDLTHDLKWVERLQPKLVSNDLRRLYTMGFLRRRKVERRCRNKRGREYNCGYKYMYQINNQGWSYLDFLLREFKKENFRKENASFSEQLEEEIHEFNEDLKDMRIAARKWLAVKHAEGGNIVLAEILLEMANEEIERKFEGKGYLRFAEGRRIKEAEMRHRVREVEFINMINSLRRELEEKNERLRILEEELKECRELLKKATNRAL